MYRNFFKRIFDFFLSGLALIVLSPIMLLTAVLVRVRLGSPVFFCQDRPGRDEKLFRLLKFRTMTDQRDKQGNLLPDEVRLTGFGRMLRSTSLDELPELINILKGDMAVVGPRPLLVRYLPFYKPEERVRHSVRPGLTGLAQISGRNNLGWDERLGLDAEYAKNITILGDVKIILRTVGKVFRRSDIASGEQLLMQDLDRERAWMKKEKNDG